MSWRDPKFWDQVAQYGVLLTIVGLYLTTNKSKWGFVVTLTSEPFWFITSYLNHQWAVFVISAVYTVILLKGIRKWFREDRILRRQAQVS